MVVHPHTFLSIFSQKGEVERYKAVEATARSWGLLAKVIAWTLASWISQINIRLSYDLTLLSALVALAAALILREILLAADLAS